MTKKPVWLVSSCRQGAVTNRQSAAKTNVAQTLTASLGGKDKPPVLPCNVLTLRHSRSRSWPCGLGSLLTHLTRQRNRNFKPDQDLNARLESNRSITPLQYSRS
jgi:hypothetical protein